MLHLNLKVGRLTKLNLDSDLPHEVNCAKLSSPSLCMTKPSNCKNPEVMTEVDPSEWNKPEEDPEPELENDEEDKQEVDEDLDEDLTGPKSKRRDVILKTLLRKWRKYFQKLFNNHTKFLKNKKKELSCYYKSCIEKFIQECLPLDTTLNIGFHMGALLYPQEMIRCVDKFVYPNGIKTSSRKKLMKKKISTYKDQVDILHDILYKFSKEKLEKFIAIPELAIIFLYFIENSNECNSTDIETKICKELMTKCKKTLKSSKKSKGVATLFDPCGADE